MMFTARPLFHDGTYYTYLSFPFLIPFVLLYTCIVKTLSYVCSKRANSESFTDDCLLIEDGDCFELPPADLEVHPLAIVTGSNTGIGLELSYHLVTRGYNVIVACRSRDKGETAAREINVRTMTNNNRGGKAFFLHPCDLSSFQSIQDFVKQFHKCSDLYNGSLNILVNNAGANVVGVSDDGLDLSFQTNFLGHYLLTRLLLPDLKRARNYVSYPTKYEAGRIVNLASVLHHFASPMPRAKEEWKRNWIEKCGVNAYAHSKLAAILFTIELNQRYDDVWAMSVNPGAVNSDIWRFFPPLVKKLVIEPMFRLLFLTPAQGSSAVLAAAIGCKIPKSVIYLQPYWLPTKSTICQGTDMNKNWCYECPFPAFEIIGPYVGHAATEPRLPQKDRGAQSSAELWSACEDILLEKIPNLKLPQ